MPRDTTARTSAKFHELIITRELPSSRSVARHVMKFAQREEVSGEELLRVVKADPALAARVVKAANAEARRDPRPLIAIPDALSMLGAPRVRELALEVSMISIDAQKRCRHFDYDSFWQESLAVGIAYSAVAKFLQIAPAEEAFVVGLLSRVGALALASVYPQEYDAVLTGLHARQGALAELERGAFATDHLELTADLLADWGFPAVFVDGVRHQNTPDAHTLREPSRGFKAVRALQLACVIAPTRGAMAEESAAGERALALARDLAIDDGAYAAIMEDIALECRRYRTFLFASETGAGARAEEAVVDVTESTAPSRLRLVVADDDPVIAEYLAGTLAGAGHEVFIAANGQRALELAVDKRPDVILTDWVMPEMDGVSLCRALRRTALGRGIYIMVMTDSQDANRLVEAFDAGADDYVRKPVTPKVLKARLRAAERVLRLQTDLERDRADMRRLSAELAIEGRRHQAAGLNDALTGLPNRQYSMEMLEQTHLAAQRARDPFACLLVELDAPRPGDALLERAARLLRAAARAHDTVSRIDEATFFVVCPGTGAKGAHACAERLRTCMDEAGISASVGGNVWQSALASSEDMLHSAQAALAAARASGGNRVSFKAAPKPSAHPVDVSAPVLLPVAVSLP